MGTYTVWPTASVGSAANEVLVKEDVSDLITNLFPLDTPLQQILSRRPMSNVFTQQPVDTFSGITRTNAYLIAGAFAGAGETSMHVRPEGFTYTSGTPAYPGKLQSVAEIQGLQFSVSDTDRAMSMYGIQDRFAYEALKTTQTVVNNFELSFWWSLGTPPQGKDFDTDGGNVFIARQTQGLAPWILFSGLQRTSSTPTPASHVDGNGNELGTNSLYYKAGTTAYNANGLTLDQAMFKDKIMDPWWQLTGRTGGAVGFAGPKVKGLFSQFALTANGAINNRNIEAAAKTVSDTVDYYDTDFGLISINLCRYLSLGQSTTIDLDTATDVVAPWNETMLLIHPQYWSIGVVRGVHYSPIAKTGDLETGLIRGEQALVCTNPQAGTGVTNCIP